MPTKSIVLPPNIVFKRTWLTASFLPCYLTRDKTSWRYQTHYQLKQKAVVRAFQKSSSDWRKRTNPQWLIPSVALGLGQ